MKRNLLAQAFDIRVGEIKRRLKVTAEIEGFSLWMSLRSPLFAGLLIGLYIACAAIVLEATPTPTPTPQISTKTGLTVTGTWNSNIGLTYQITQAGGEFVWTVIGIDQIGKGTILAQELTANWSGTGGPGAAKGIVTKFAPDGAALRIEWDNGVIFTRQTAEISQTPGEATPTPVTPEPTPEPTPAVSPEPTPQPTPAAEVTPAMQTGTNLEIIVGSLSSTETIKVRANLPTGIIPIPISLSNPVPVQLAKFYVHVVRDRLGGRAALDESRRTLTISQPPRLLQAGDSRDVLETNMLEGLNRAADAEAAKGSESLANWYVQWAQWLDGLGINFGAAGAQPGVDPASWALSQPPGVLKAALRKRLNIAVDKLSATPIQLP